MNQVDRLARVRMRCARSTRLVNYEPRYASSMLAVAREMHARSTFRSMPLDEDKLTRALTTVTPNCYFKLAVRGEEVLGGFFGTVSKTFFCDEQCARDLGWWVKESARGSSAAVLLLADFEQWARVQGARFCFIGQTMGVNVAQTAKLYENCGYTLVGYNSCKEL